MGVFIQPGGEGYIEHAVFGLGFVPLGFGFRVRHDATTRAPGESVASCFGFEEGRPDRHGKFEVLVSEPTAAMALEIALCLL